MTTSPRVKHLAYAAVLTSGLLLAMDSRATPPSDPICGGASSLISVQAIRSQMAANAQAAVQFAQALVNPPFLGVDRHDPSVLPALLLGGDPGQAYTLEMASDPSSTQWTPRLSVLMGQDVLVWKDEALATAPTRFYRLRSEDPAALNEPVSNFRLIDHQGKSQDLFYHTELKFIAVLEAGNNLADIAPMIPTLNQLASLYANKLQVWILLGDPSAQRSNVLKAAQSLKINFPVLQDKNGLAARSVGLSRAGEVALIQPPAFTVGYRGAVAAAPGQPAAETFLGQALAALDTATTFTFLRTPASGAGLFDPAEPVPDYARDVAPILHQHCAICHRPNDVAPFALTNYSVVELWAPAIKHALLSNKMPPWHADPEYGHWANEISLPGEKRSALIRWINAGAPRGDGPDPLTELPVPPSYNKWPADLGQPDVQISIPLQSIKAVGAEPYRYVFTQAQNPSNVWLKAAVILPSNFRAVHHYLVWLGQIGNQGIDGFSSYQSAITTYVPGYEPYRFPADSGVFLSKSNALTFNLHYTPFGVATNDQPVLALWYHQSKPAKVWHGDGPAFTGFMIPPRASDYAVQTDVTFPNAVRLHRLNPHMHLRGKRMMYRAFYPDGKNEILLSVPDYDFNWQVGYEFAEPKLLPAGTRINISGGFDNSPQNLSNPDPNVSVGWGDQSSKEMFVGFIDYTQ